MAKVKTPRDLKGSRHLKILKNTTTSVLQSRIPPRSAVHMKHCHSLKASRQVHRIDRRSWEQRVAELLNLAERHRYDKANALHHTLQKVQLLLQKVSKRERRLAVTSSELKQTTNYLQTIMDSMVDILIATDLDGRVSEVNLAVEHLTHFSRKELLGHPFHTLFTEHAEAESCLREVLESKSVTDRELTIICRDGSVIPVLSSGAGLNGEDGEITGILISARDIRDLKKAQEAREEFARELQRANADLEEFASVASHDLAEPLKKLMNYAEGLSDRYQEVLDEQARHDLQDMVNQTRAMQDLVKSVLVYSKIGSGVATWSRFESRLAVEQALNNLSSSIGESACAIELGEFPQVRGIQAQLARVFQNLIGNAIKYRDCEQKQRCRVHITAAPIEGGEGLDQDSAEPRWVFRVEDNGLGIDPDFSEDIFEMFTRLHGEEYEGAGMGLAITRKIVNRHNGRIWVESTPGVGSSFIFTWP